MNNLFRNIYLLLQKNYKLLGKTSTGSSLSEPMIPVSPYHSTNELSQSTIDVNIYVQIYLYNLYFFRMKQQYNY